MIKGDNNVVIIGKGCQLSKTSFWISGNDNRIEIGDHVWVGLQSLILKDSVIADNSVVAARSTINKQFEKSGYIIAGAPAKQIKENINWDRQKL